MGRFTILLFLSVTASYLGQQTNHFVNSVSNARTIPKIGNAVAHSKSNLDTAALGRYSLSLHDTETFYVGCLLVQIQKQY